MATIACLYWHVSRIGNTDTVYRMMMMSMTIMRMTMMLVKVTQMACASQTCGISMSLCKDYKDQKSEARVLFRCDDNTFAQTGMRMLITILMMVMMMILRVYVPRIYYIYSFCKHNSLNWLPDALSLHVSS